ncbi:MAG: nitroreductase [Saprospiraceae bacterium]
MRYNLSELKEIIRNRRSVKPEKYSSRKVLKDVVVEILNNAIWAPTHGLTQPWYFVVFQGEELEKLGTMMADTYKNSCDPDAFLERKYQKMLMRPSKASVVIAICMKRQEIEKIPEIEEIAAVACAVQNMYLTATAYGLGPYWSSGAVSYSDEMKEYLNLGDKDKCLGLFYLGYTKEPWPTSHRQPLEYHSEWRN